MYTWWRKPTFHFIVIGAILFVAYDLWPALQGNKLDKGKRENIVITEQRLQELHVEYVKQTGIEPNGSALQTLVREAVDDEALYLEARRLSLDFGDLSIRRRLVQKMRAVTTTPGLSEEDLYRAAVKLGFDNDIVIRRLLQEKMRLLLKQKQNGTLIQEKEVVAYIEKNQEQFLESANVSFNHVFLNQELHGQKIQEHAKTLLTKLRRKLVTPEIAVQYSDAFLLNYQFQAQSQTKVTRYFGAEFAESVFKLTPGTWSEPINSPFGLHLVWVSKKMGRTPPPINDIWEQAAQVISEVHSSTNLTKGLEKLRQLYKVEIQPNQFGIKTNQILLNDL